MRRFSARILRARPDCTHVQIAVRVHHDPDVGFDQFESCELGLAAKQREKLDVDRHIVSGEKWLFRECTIVSDLETGDFDRDAPSHLRLYLPDLDRPAERVAHAREYSLLVMRDDRTQVEKCVSGKRDGAQHHRANHDARDEYYPAHPRVPTARDRLSLWRY